MRLQENDSFFAGFRRGVPPILCQPIWLFRLGGLQEGIETRALFRLGGLQRVRDTRVFLVVESLYRGESLG